MNSVAVPETADGLFRKARQKLENAGLPTADLDTSLLLQFATGLTVLERMTNPGRVVTAEKADLFREVVARRLAREPVHRILGEREFYGLMLKLNASTLVPRPDTEALVDLVVPFARDIAVRNGLCRILDLGTGSGAVALALISLVPDAIATGTDISREALAAANTNASSLGLADRFRAERSDWFESVSGKYDVIVSNPPYIRSSDIDHLDADVRDHDPLAALDGGSDGLHAYRILAEQAHSYLATGGAIAVEIGYDQKQAVTNLFEASSYRKKDQRNDYSGHERALFFVK